MSYLNKFLLTIIAFTLMLGFEYLFKGNEIIVECILLSAFLGCFFINLDKSNCDEQPSDSENEEEK